MIETTAQVLENRFFGAGYCHLRLSVANHPDVQPGQFAMLKPAGQREPLLRRAMAYYRTKQLDDNQLEVEFIYHILGPGTQALSYLRSGDHVEFLGPLGQSFSLAPAIATQGAIIVTGGVGSPAVLMLAEQLRDQSIPTEIFLGARSAADLIGEADFRALSIPLTITTDDGSSGEKGFITAPFEHRLSQLTNRPIVYTCGPDVMMHRVTQIAQRFNLKTYASLEARMACGFGVCVGCVVEVAKSSAESSAESSYHRVCIEGPVFDASEVIW